MHDKRTIILTLIAALFTSTMQAQYQYRYWFDQDAPTTVAGTGSGTWNVNARNLAEGFHTLRMMVSENGSNVWSSPRTLYFVKAPAAADLQPMTYVASVDGRVVGRGTVNASNGTAVINVDVNDVAAGLITGRKVIFTPSADIKEVLKSTNVSITCIDKDGNVVKRVQDDATNETVDDGGDDTQGSGTGSNTGGSNGNGDDGDGME